MRGIAIIAYDKWRYLHVTLDGLKRVRSIENHPVFISIDNEDSHLSIESGVRERFAEVIGNFQSIIKGVHYHASNIGNLANRLFSIRMTFDLDPCINEVVYIEDDQLVHPCTFNYLDQKDRKAFWICLSGTSSGKDYYDSKHYRSQGNLITRENFNTLEKWIQLRSYVGLWNPIRNRFIDDCYQAYDSAFQAYANTHPEALTLFVGKKCVAHFGLFGMHKSRKGAPPEDLELESRMFRGQPDQWLDNVVEIFEDFRRRGITHPCLYPGDFRYL